MDILGKLGAFAPGGKSGGDATALEEMRGLIAAISHSQAVIEFCLDGTILTANDSFLHALGYTLSEIQGKHQSLFVEPAFRESAEYRAFWAKLGRGEYDDAVYKPLGKIDRRSGADSN
jgi:methyl-accepting chemotaxis protein